MLRRPNLRKPIKAAKPVKPAAPVQKDPRVTRRCTKMAQLQMLLYHWKVECERIDFQRELLHNFFNPRINNAIEKFREHIGKMQATAAEDYDFVIERTGLFYDHKLKRLEKEVNASRDKLKQENADIEGTSERAVSEARATISEIEKEISEAEESLAKLCSEAMEGMKKNVENAKEMGRKEIDACEKECEQRMRMEERDSQERCRRLAKEHEQNMEELRMSFQGVRKNPFDMQRIVALRNNGLREKVGDVMNECNEMVAQQRANFGEMWSQMMNESGCDLREAEAIREKVKSLDEMHGIVMEQLREEKRAREEQFKTELLNEERRLEDVKEHCRVELEEAERAANADGMKTLSEINELEKSLEIERNQMEAQLADIEGQVEKKLGVSLNAPFECVDLLQELEDAKRENETKRVLFAEQLESQKESIQMSNDAEKRSAADRHSLINGKTSDAIQTKMEELDKLKLEQGELQNQYKKSLELLDREEQAETQTLRKSLSETMEAQRESFDNSLNDLRQASASLIDEKSKEHTQRCQDLRTELSAKHQAHLDSLQVPCTDLQDIENAYRNQLSELEQSLSVANEPISEETVEKLDQMIADLTNQLQSRPDQIGAERNSLLAEWEQKVSQESDRHQQVTSIPLTDDSMDDAILLLQNKLDDVRATLGTESEPLQKQLDALKGISTELHSRIESETQLVLSEFDEPTREIRRQLEEEMSESNAQISQRESDVRNEIDQVLQVLQQQTSQWNERTQEIVKDQSQIEAKFKTDYAELDRQLSCVLDELRTQRTLLEHKHVSEVNALLEKHRRQMASLARKRDDQIQINTENVNFLNEKLDVFIEKSEAKLRALEEEYSTKIDNLKAEKTVRLELLEERLRHTEEHYQKIKKELQYNPKVGRPQDIEALERLQFILHTKKTHFANLVKELSQCKILYVQQEKRNDTKIPEVGVRQKLRSNPRTPAIA